MRTLIRALITGGVATAVVLSSGMADHKLAGALTEQPRPFPMPGAGMDPGLR
ncbi:hypothetical protein [Streptosporangium sp. NPDC001681]|uniref:hypothetical protein n=1 Tax=Streptosporangium sp. NPDC001681 TaxID=3154395 RepID=UPI003334297E